MAGDRVKPPRLRLLGRVAGLPVYLVSGQQVRGDLFLDFTMGGNGGVYDFVPRNEIWLDDGMSALDLNATCLHELVERFLMLHRGMTYDSAHDIASSYERPFRRELAERPSRTFDAARVGVAYQRFLGGERPAQKKPAQLQREIDEVLARGRRRRVQRATRKML